MVVPIADTHATASEEEQGEEVDMGARPRWGARFGLIRWSIPRWLIGEGQ
jgi:hypothetical protein